MPPIRSVLLACAVTGAATAAAANPAGIAWVPIGQGFEIARTETTIGQFRRFAQAAGLVTEAERRGGGQVYEAGWVTKPGWTWRAPFGNPAVHDDEPAVHVTFDEAAAFCRWAGGRLPSDAEWLLAAYTEQRTDPPPPLARGRASPYPPGLRRVGAQCRGDCGPEAARRAVRHGATLLRGDGHARAGTTVPGVNGLFDMGANAWEWVDEPRTPPGSDAGRAERRTRGGSWWYGAAQMRAEFEQGKPADTAVVYIGFRCVRPR
ncbi:MAG: formylglycine-generating enzyme family protein [Pseudomonadota bacterium]